MSQMNEILTRLERHVQYLFKLVEVNRDRIVMVSVHMKNVNDETNTREKLFAVPFNATVTDLKEKIFFYLTPKVGSIVKESLSIYDNNSGIDNELVDGTEWVRGLPAFMTYGYEIGVANFQENAIDSGTDSARNAESRSEYGNITSRNPRAI